ncbi:MAG: alpha/beta hydrolase [Gammaproteobacteria bacterium]|nr:alpha/beta hydrolase [Gammaproteobacteria bacterium]
MKIISTFSILILLGFTVLGCELIINKFAFHPDNVNVIPADKLPHGIQEITISTKDKVKITSLYLPSSESDKLLIYFHGNAGNIYHRIPSLLKLSQLGVNVIGVSYRGYGKSDGDPSEEGIYLDGQAIFQYAVERMGFSKENIIIFGRSIGTTVAINTAQNKKIGGVILVTPLTSGKDQAKVGGLWAISSLAGNSFDNFTKIENIDSPLLVIHGTDDSVIPYSMGKKIFDKAKVKKEFVKIKGANHNNLHDVFEQEYWLPIIQFIKSL